MPATDGPSGLDAKKLLAETGHVTLDVGFMNTAACTSKITFIDGDEGILRYRGYPIDQLAEKAIVPRGLVPADLRRAPDRRTSSSGSAARSASTRCWTRTSAASSTGSRATRIPMAVLSSAVSALSTFYQDSLDPFDERHVEMSTVRLMAKLPTIAAYAYKKSVGQPLLYPDNSLGYVENFLRLTFGVPAEPYEVDPTMARVLDMLFVLHADHEQNCSTSTVRLVGLEPGEPLRLGLRRRQRAVRPAARRSEPGRPRDAREDPRGRRRRRLRSSGG